MAGPKRLKRQPCSTECCVVVDCRSLGWPWKRNMKTCKARNCCPICLPAHRSTRVLQDADSWLIQESEGFQLCPWPSLPTPINACATGLQHPTPINARLFTTRFTKLLKYLHSLSIILCLVWTCLSCTPDPLGLCNYRCSSVIICLSPCLL